MRKIITLVLATALPLTALADKVELEQECTISYKGKTYVSGPCTLVVRDQKFVSIKGTNRENGVTFNLIGDEDKGTALLMGAGTFVLAEGEVKTNTAGATYSWPNGYALQTSSPQ